MTRKFEEDGVPPASDLSGANLWLPFFHRQYEGSYEGVFRRAYMDLARGDFYDLVYRRARIKQGAAVLDIGSGLGNDLIKLHERGHRGMKVALEKPVLENDDANDIKHEQLTWILTDAGIQPFKVVLGSAEDLPFENNSFDVVWAANVLQELDEEHVDLAIDQIHRVLKRRGKLIIVTNSTGNKPFHHGLLVEKAIEIGGIAPPPFSARFNSETGPVVMDRHSHQFSLREEIFQEGEDNLELDTEEKIESLIRSFRTYWYDITPVMDPSWSSEQARAELEAFAHRLRSARYEVLDGIRKDLNQRASEGRPAKDTIKRVAYIYKKVGRINLGRVFFGDMPKTEG